MNKNNKTSDIIHLNLNNDDIVVQINRTHYDGSIDFAISSVKQNTIDIIKSKSLSHAVIDIACKIFQLSGENISLPDISIRISDLYHNYMKEVLKKITEMKVLFTGGTLYDYQ